MRNRTYGGVRGRKTKVGEKLFRFPPTRLSSFCQSIVEWAYTRSFWWKKQYAVSMLSLLIIAVVLFVEALGSHLFLLFAVYVAIVVEIVLYLLWFSAEGIAELFERVIFFVS